MGMQMPRQLALAQMDPAATSDSGLREMNAYLVQALLEQNLVLAKQLLQQRADVNFADADPAQRSPLHHILDASNAGKATLEAVNFLVKFKANINAGTARGETPLHLALRQFGSVPPVVFRMLLCQKADINLQDSSGATPIDNIRDLARAPNNDPARLRQLLDEVTCTPTVDLICIEQQQVQRALFADTTMNLICFSTESSIGLYSLKDRRITFQKKLKQQQVTSMVKNIAVNPRQSTIAICLELTGGIDRSSVFMDNVFMVWPNGRLSDEEPLKFNVKVSEGGGDVTACVKLSRCAENEGPQVVLGRLASGKTICWHLNANRSQIEIEQIFERHSCGVCEISDSGSFIALANPDDKVDLFERPAGQQRYTLLNTLPFKPQELSIQQSLGKPTGECKVAMVMAAAPESAPTINIFSVGESHTTCLYRLQTHSLSCHSLDFCLGTDTHVAAGFQDGTCILYDLDSGTTSLCHGSRGMRSVSTNHDGSLIVIAAENYFQIRNVSPYEPSPQ